MRRYEFDEDCDESAVPWTSFNEEIKHVVIAQRITTIGNYAFSNCTLLSSITIPDTATTIGNGTFYECTSLETITLPESVTMIGDKAFERCTSVTSLALPETSKVIDSRAFMDTHALCHMEHCTLRAVVAPHSHLPPPNATHRTALCEPNVARRPLERVLSLQTTQRLAVSEHNVHQTLTCDAASSLWTRAVCTVVSAPAPFHVRFSISALMCR